MSAAAARLPMQHKALVAGGLLVLALAAWTATPARAQDIGPGALLQELSALNDATPRLGQAAASSNETRRGETRAPGANGRAMKPALQAKAAPPAAQPVPDLVAPTAQNR